jgi:hypothetical protein
MNDIDITIRALGDICLKRGVPCNNDTIYLITTNDYFIQREPHTMSGDVLCIRDKTGHQWSWDTSLLSGRLMFHTNGLSGKKLAAHEKAANRIASTLYSQLREPD